MKRLAITLLAMIALAHQAIAQPVTGPMKAELNLREVALNGPAAQLQARINLGLGALATLGIGNGLTSDGVTLSATGGGGSITIPTATLLGGNGSSLLSVGIGTSFAVSNNLLVLNGPSSGTLGGVVSMTPVAHEFLTGINTAGVPLLAQPAAADISGLGALATLSAGTGLSTAGGAASVAYGTAAGTAAQGNDSRILGAFQAPGGTAGGGLAMGANLLSGGNVSFSGGALTGTYTGSPTYVGSLTVNNPTGAALNLSGTLQSTANTSFLNAATVAGVNVTDIGLDVEGTPQAVMFGTYMVTGLAGNGVISGTGHAGGAASVLTNSLTGTTALGIGHEAIVQNLGTGTITTATMFEAHNLVNNGTIGELIGFEQAPPTQNAGTIGGSIDFHAQDWTGQPGVPATRYSLKDDDPNKLLQTAGTINAGNAAIGVQCATTSLTCISTLNNQGILTSLNAASSAFDVLARFDNNNILQLGEGGDVASVNAQHSLTVRGTPVTLSTDTRLLSAFNTAYGVAYPPHVLTAYGSHLMEHADAGACLLVTDASADTFTFNSANMAAGDTGCIEQGSTGAITVTGAQSPSGVTATAGQYDIIYWQFDGTVAILIHAPASSGTQTYSPCYGNARQLVSATSGSLTPTSACVYLTASTQQSLTLGAGTANQVLNIVAKGAGGGAITMSFFGTSQVVDVNAQSVLNLYYDGTDSTWYLAN